MLMMTLTRVRTGLRLVVLAVGIAGLPAYSTAQEYRIDDATILNLIRRINEYAVPSKTTQPSDQKDLLRLLDEGRLLISTAANIRAFRLNDNQGTVSKLVQISELDDRSIRISASLILANVVDNTTLCVVLDRLLQPTEISDDLRFNLVQVVRVASRNTTYAENYKWTTATVEHIRSQIKGRQGDYEKTLSALQLIETNLAAMDPALKDRKLGEAYPGIDKACMELPNIKQLSAGR
jgi:hypothetical protein